MLINPPELSPEEIRELQERNKKVFQPEVLSANMLFYSTYIAMFEIFKKTIVTNVRDFFWMGIDHGKDIIDPSYKSEILSRRNETRIIDDKKIKNVFMATCDWAFEQELLTIDEYKSIDELTKYRNLVTHEMATQIYDEKVRPDFSVFDQLINTFSNYAYRWFTNFELAMGIEGLENEDITYEEYSQYNPLGLVWLYGNFINMVEYREDGFLHIKDKSEREIFD